MPAETRVHPRFPVRFVVRCLELHENVFFVRSLVLPAVSSFFFSIFFLLFRPPGRDTQIESHPTGHTRFIFFFFYLSFERFTLKDVAREKEREKYRGEESKARGLARVRRVMPVAHSFPCV